MSVTIGDEKLNNKGSLMKVVCIRSQKDIDVYFPEYDWTATNRQAIAFVKGKITSPFCTSVFGMAIGARKVPDNEKNIYRSWKNMLSRCYNEKNRNKAKTYINVTVNKEWLSYESYRLWFLENYYEVDNELMTLDKDLLLINNKEYSKDTCIFVPQRINAFLTNKKLNKPNTGVFEYQNKYYVSGKNIDGKFKRMGTFETLEDAKKCYAENRNKYAKELAKLYKDRIPNKLYIALLNYKEEQRCQ